MEAVLIHNQEAEQSLLSSIMLNNDLIFLLEIESEDFALEFHKKIFEQMKSSINAGIGANLHTMKKFISDLVNQEYFSELMTSNSFLTPLEILKILRDLRFKRELKEIGAEIVKKTLEGEKNSQQIKDCLLERVENISLKDDKRRVCKAIDAVRKAFDKKEVSLLKTGFDSIDRITGGFDDGSFVVLAGRPGMGKSSLGMNIAIRMAKGFKGQPSNQVLFVCLEASDEQFARRLIANLSSIELSKLRKNQLTGQHEFESFKRACEEVEKLQIQIKDKGGLTLNELRYEIKRFALKGGKLVVIDYIQLINHKTRGGRVEDITEITNVLKGIALEFKIVIIGLSQLSRAVENREDKRPQLSDLRESGSIEQDADVVIFAFRPVYYLKNDEEKFKRENKWHEWQKEMQRLKNVAYAIVAKVREGEPSDAQLHFVGEFQRFTEIN